MADTINADITPAARQERQTGGDNRTPRSEITTVLKKNRKYEIRFFGDKSGSMDWSARDENNRGEDYPHPNSRRAIFLAAFPLLVKALAAKDSMAAKEQKGGSDEKGGLLSYMYSGKPQELGDVNESNLARRLDSIQWGGGTYVMPAVKLADKKTQAEFEEDSEEEGTLTLLDVFLTDGAAEDWHELHDYFSKNISADHVAVVGIIGHGDIALKVFNDYNDLSDQLAASDEFGHRHMEVVSFDGVTNPIELAEDLIAMVV